MVLVAEGVPSTEKVTVPVGVPAPGATALTVFVKITAWPNTEGLVEEVSDDVASAWFTVRVDHRGKEHRLAKHRGIVGRDEGGRGVGLVHRLRQGRRVGAGGVVNVPA